MCARPTQHFFIDCQTNEENAKHPYLVVPYQKYHFTSIDEDLLTP